MTAALVLVLLAVFTLNVPFGLWRSSVRRLSAAWFLAVHLPVPLVFVVRWLAHVDWTLARLPAFLVAYFAGQYVGGRLNRRAGRSG